MIDWLVTFIERDISEDDVVHTFMTTGSVNKKTLD